MLPFPALDRLKADLDALRPLAPEQEQRVLQKFRLEWNYNSNAIEGNSLTLGETKALLTHGVVASGKTIRDHDDIRNHNKVVSEVESLVSEERPITEHLIREMHEMLLGKEPYYVPAQTAGGVPTRQLIEPGSYKKLPNQTITATGEALSFASPEETGAQMTELVDWYRQEEASPTLHPVALATEFHHRFVRIHPFDDGNGRMSRLLMNLILLRHGYPMTVIKATDRNRYLAALAAADAGEFELFLQFIVENVEASLQLMIRAAKGESIEEPDDLDKKLALLKKQVVNRREFADDVWNLKTQDLFHKEILSPSIIYIWETLRKFNDFFLRTSITVRIQDEMSELAEFSSDTQLEEFTQYIEKIASRNRLIEHIQINFAWSGLKNINNSFRLNPTVDWNFEKSEYYMRIRNGLSFRPEQTEATYQHPINLDETHRIIRQLANKVYDFIAAKVAEADTPSA